MIYVFNFLVYVYINMSIVWRPEAQLSDWIGNSIILMTGSLVFYGFTKIDDPVLQINPFV